ncbi:MAG: LacI family transcriptional regulator, partial [Anaerolineae bacterium]|nr:LacI family transcriptional regulator [Anaerolineae bacterium]
MPDRLTLEEIGRLAGVSRATVSRVINKPDNVTPELRERVERVIAETGFQPNMAARSLASRRSNIIGLIIPSVAQTLFTDPYFPALIQGISQACNDRQQTLSLFIFYSREEQHQLYQRATQFGLVDGLIVTADEVHEAVGTSENSHDPLLHLLQQRQMPFVYLGRPSVADEANFVDVDNVTGA